MVAVPDVSWRSQAWPKSSTATNRNETTQGAMSVPGSTRAWSSLSGVVHAEPSVNLCTRYVGAVPTERFGLPPHDQIGR